MAFKDPGGIEKNRPARGKGHPGTDSRGGPAGGGRKQEEETEAGTDHSLRSCSRFVSHREKGYTMARSSRWPYIRKMAWDRDRKVKAVCWICGMPIDYSVAPSSTDQSWEPDHVIPVHQNPDLELDLNNIKASHRTCNRARGDGTNGNNDLGQQSRIW